MFAVFDLLRQMQGDTLELFGLGPAECDYDIVASSARWRLRQYGQGDMPLLIVAAPIKRPYIWDLAPEISAVRRCLEGRLGVYLLEWLPPHVGDNAAGLEDYAGRAIEEAVASCSRETGGAKFFLIGHSWGARWRPFSQRSALPRSAVWSCSRIHCASKRGAARFETHSLRWPHPVSR